MRSLPVLILALLATAAAAQGDIDDATVLALELDGPGGIIRVEPTTLAAIDAELALIRAQLPQLGGIHVHPAWVPGEVIVLPTDEAMAAIQAGTFTGFDDLFAEYPLAEMRLLIDTYLVLEFVEPLHPVNLAALIGAIDGVIWAEPNGVGGDGDDITIEALGWYVFKRGWGDCPAGCINNHYWDVRVQDGVATIVEEWGDDLPVRTEARSWSDVKTRWR